MKATEITIEAVGDNDAVEIVTAEREIEFRGIDALAIETLVHNAYARKDRRMYLAAEQGRLTRKLMH